MTDHQVLMNLLTRMGNLQINAESRYRKTPDYPAKEYNHGQYVTAREVRKYILDHVTDTRPLEDREEEQNAIEDVANWNADENGNIVYTGPVDGRAIII